MSSIKQNVLPSLCNTSFNVALKTYSAVICQLMFMGPKLTEALKQKNSVAIMKQAVSPLPTSGRLVNQNKIEYIITKGGVDSNPLHLYAKKGLDMGLCNTLVVVVSDKSGSVIAAFKLKSFRKPGEKRYEGLPFQFVIITITDLLGRLFDFSRLKFPILMSYFQHLLPKAKTEDSVYKKPAVLNMFCRQLLFETREFAKDLLTKCLVSINSKPTNSIPLPSELKELAKKIEKLVKKPVSTTSSNVKAELKVTESVPDQNYAKTLQTLCDECREPIKLKKFFDERRFGILEKCKCVICYGCIRKLTGSTSRVVKGPVRCPICFVMSGNVASSANWVQDEDKVDFFQKYCTNVQNTYIKMKLGWTSFPNRKDDFLAFTP